MNKENQFYENEISTGIHDSCSKSTYSSRFLQTQKKNLFQKKVLPSRYQKAAVSIQRYWRFRQAMKRKICQKVIEELYETNQCYVLQNQILSKLVNQYENIVKFKQSLMLNCIKDSLTDYECMISQIKKQCVITSFKMEKKNPKKELLSELIHKKEEQKQMNLMLNREKLIIQEELQDERKQHEILLQQFKKLNMQHLELTKEKHQLAHKNAQKMLETSKFGSRQQSLRNDSKSKSKTFIIDFFDNFQN